MTIIYEKKKSIIDQVWEKVAGMNNFGIVTQINYLDQYLTIFLTELKDFGSYLYKLYRKYPRIIKNIVFH